MKFDYIIQNPPYGIMLYVKFINLALNNAHHIHQITPSTFLLKYIPKCIENNFKTQLIYNEIRDKLQNHMHTIVTKQFNDEFNMMSVNTLSITYIDFTKTYNEINVYLCDDNYKLKNIYDLTLFSKSENAYNILNSIWSKYINLDYPTYKDRYIDYNDDIDETNKNFIRVSSCLFTNSGGAYPSKLSNKIISLRYLTASFINLLSNNPSPHREISKVKHRYYEYLYGTPEECKYYLDNVKYSNIIFPLLNTLTLFTKNVINLHHYFKFINDDRFISKMDLSEDEKKLLNEISYNLNVLNDDSIILKRHSSLKNICNKYKNLIETSND